MQPDDLPAVTVAELYCPFPDRLHAHADAVGRHTLEWALGHGLLTDERIRQRFVAGRYGMLAGRTNPDAEADLLAVVADWYAWLFLFDDLGDVTDIGTSASRLRGVTGRFMETLRRPRDDAAPDDGPFEVSLRDLARRMDGRGSSHWMARFVESCDSYFDSLVWEADNRAAHRTPEAHAYAKMRRNTGAVGTSFVVGELADGLDVPPEIAGHPAVLALQDSANNIVCWQNDLFSLPKELQVGEVHNLVVVTRQRNGGSLQEAADTVVAMHDEEMRRFVTLSDAMPGFAGDAERQLDGVVALLRHWVRGNLDWSKETGRYQAGVSATPAPPA